MTRKKSKVNWDPVDETVLANEQVIDGRGWRSGALVEQRELTQWFFKISDYSEDLLDALDGLDGWPEKVRIMQRNWIGKSEGMRLLFELMPSTGPARRRIEVFTTRPDTHLRRELRRAVAGPSAGHRAGRRRCRRSRRSSTSATARAPPPRRWRRPKSWAISPASRVKHPVKPGETLPVYVANFVLMDYGTGAIFGCPAHDQRDLDFARKYDLNVIPVVLPPDADSATFAVGNEAYVGPGTIFNSEFLDGLDDRCRQEDDRRAISAAAQVDNRAQGVVETNYRLRDWGISRQRYWGCPIPVIHCDEHGVVPVPDDQLPVVLPDDVTFDRPGNPLDHHPTWKHVNCPVCGKPARRETDTMDTFVDSSWYFARFTAPHAATPTIPGVANRWLPVDQYIGGVEHAILHLLYSPLLRPRDAQDRPSRHRRAVQGPVHPGHGRPRDLSRPATATGSCPPTSRSKAWATAAAPGIAETGAPIEIGSIEKMSKSKKNVVDPDEIVGTYGADTARWFMLSDSPPERDVQWTEAGIEGASRFQQRVWKLVHEALEIAGMPPSGETPAADIEAIRKLIHRAVTGRRREHRGPALQHAPSPRSTS